MVWRVFRCQISELNALINRIEQAGRKDVADFIKTFLKTNRPVLSLRGYDLPPFVKEGWLLVCTSYSGNTEETISVLEEALKRGIKPI